MVEFIHARKVEGSEHRRSNKKFNKKFNKKANKKANKYHRSSKQHHIARVQTNNKISYLAASHYWTGWPVGQNRFLFRSKW